MAKIAPTRDFLTARVAVDVATQCWNWKLSLNNWGYGRLGANYSPRGAHQASYVAFKGAIPAGLCVLHECDNPKCINPEHLFLGSVATNNADKERKGRTVVLRGDKQGNAKLSDDAVRHIRAAPDGPGVVARLAKQHGVSRRAVRLAKDEKTWRHVS